MSVSVKILIGALLVLGWAVAPTMLVWGWARWSVRPKTSIISSIASFASLALASLSALLAISSMVVAKVIGGFPFYDPTLLRIYRWGALISLAALATGLCGVWRPNSLRWHAPLSGLGMLAFWVMMAEGE
jgi:uncharacterized BrkB/YihY/UPF0761 family membrane protein